MSKVTLKDIKAKFPGYLDYEQIDHKQLFICSHPINKETKQVPYIRMLVSYKTIVGYYDVVKACWVLTKQRYSVTTTKQLSQFARDKQVIWVDSL